jgi:beta-glucanase (GH16 family)
VRTRAAWGAVILLTATAFAAYSGVSRQGEIKAAYATAGAPGRTGVTAATTAVSWGAPEFTDNFNGTTLGKSWSIYNSPDAKPRRTKDSVRVSGGSLQLIGHYEAPYGYVGGGISYNTNQLYGRWEVRFRADAGEGYDPIVLLWPQGTWPDDGEIDAIEMPNGSRQGANEYVHLGKNNQQVGGKKIPATVDFTKWHTIVVDWLPDHITFWLDGKAVWTVKRASGTAANYVPYTPFHLALQNDEGCDGACKPTKATPAKVTMQVDWVKIFAMPPSPVTAAAYSPDGKYLATADGKGHVYVRSLPGYKLKETFTDAASKGVSSLAFTSLSHYVAAADGNGKTYLWTIANGALNGTVTDPASKGVRGVSYSPDGKSMSSADTNGHVYIWSEPKYKLVTTLTNPADG